MFTTDSTTNGRPAKPSPNIPLYAHKYEKLRQLTQELDAQDETVGRHLGPPASLSPFRCFWISRKLGLDTPAVMGDPFSPFCKTHCDGRAFCIARSILTQSWPTAAFSESADPWTDTFWR